MDAGLSNSEKEAITKQLKLAIGRLIRGCQTLDMEMAFDVFLDSPDFLARGRPVGGQAVQVDLLLLPDIPCL